MARDAFFDDGPLISQLQAAVKGLAQLVHALVPASAPPIDTPRSPSGKRASRPTAAQAFGQQPFVSPQWRDLPRLHVALVGLNAVGARAAESLVRSGVGKLLLVDAPQHSPVARDALCEMAFEPDEVDFSRCQALKLRLHSIDAGDRLRPKVEAFVVDVTHASDRAELQKKLKMSAVGRGDQQVDSSAAAPSATDDHEHADVGLFEALTLKRPYDAVVCCTADAAAKSALNALCLELSLPLVDVEISSTNASIAVTTVLPGVTCCLECIRAARVATPMDEVVQSLASAFPAVLPHVELTAAGLVAQQVLKCVPLSSIATHLTQNS